MSDISNLGHTRKWLILVVLCLSTFVLVLDNNVLTVAIPDISKDLDASAQDIQWIVDSYILVFAGLLLTTGSFSDRFGRRRVLMIGLAIFGLASLGAMFATSPEQLIAGRIAMGVGGALVMPGTLSILITVFNEEERRKATAIWSSALMLGIVGGPTVGGLLVEHFGWEVIFLINVPFVVLAALAARVLMPESKGPARALDWPGAILSVVGMVTLVYAIIEAPLRGWSDSWVQGSAIVCVVAIVAFLIRETTATEPMVPLSLFRDRDFCGGSATLVLIQLGTAGLMLVIPQYLQFVLGYSPAQSGMAVIPMAVTTIVGNAIGGGLGMKVGNRALAAFGATVVVAGFLVLAVFDMSSYLTAASGLAVVGLGSGLTFPAAVAALMGAVPEEHAGVGSALNDTIQQTGAALGVAILGSVLANTYTANMAGDAPEPARESIIGALATGDSNTITIAQSAFTDATSATFFVAAACSALAFLAAITVIRNRRPQNPADDFTPPTPSEHARNSA